MDTSCQSSDFSVKLLLGQLNTARKEINNLRQQIKSLRYIHEKDVDNIKQLLDIRKSGIPTSEPTIISSQDVKPGTSADDDTLKLRPIGVISTWFPNKRGTPRQPGICRKAPGKVTLHNSVFTNPNHALEGLQDFSHMWILFHFHRNDSTHVRAKVAPPRLNGIRTGIFSTRSPHRPCPIGLSLVKIIKIENYTIYFEGVDMVDQSPVLDIKPYIPQYDSPLHIEKQTNRVLESNINESDITDYDSLNNDFESNEEYTNIQSSGVYCGSTSDGIEPETDISRDEEIALRLQAEEFQANSNFENYNGTRNILQLSTINLSSASSLQTTLDDRDTFTAAVRNGDQQSENVRNIASRLENLRLPDRSYNDSVDTARINESSFAETHTSRNSRLLDGADGPNTVCGTDLDFIHRRALNSRIDNSPIRMGVREAPDGEEGFQSQAVITPSQTLSNIQIVRSTSNSNLSESADVNLSPSGEAVVMQNLSVENNFSEVRVPEWISRPRTNTLSVVFNDRALMQLNEILQDKAEEQKSAIENVLREDPRSVYLRQRWGNQFYTFLIHDLHITCRFDDTRGIVTVFQVRHAGRTCECGEPEWQCLGHSPLS